jgi:hypothetical protein
VRRLLLVPALLLPGLALGACGGGDGHQELGAACRVVREMSQVTDDPTAYASLLQQAQKDAESAVHLNPDLAAARNLLDVLDSGGVTPTSQVATATEMCGQQ